MSEPKHNGTQETQKPISAEQLGPANGVFQIMWRDLDGKLYVHQMKGSDVRALALNTKESEHLRRSLFWHMQAAFFSTVAAVFQLPPVETPGEPKEKSPIVNPAGIPYNAAGGGNSKSH